MLKYYIFISLSILMNSVSLLLLKKGAINSSNCVINLSKLSSWFYFFANGYIVLGVLIFGLAGVLWIVSLSKVDLSFAYPVTSLSYTLIAIASYYLFGEAITIYRCLGIVIVTIGVFVMCLR
jgi:drug/metabolite transporter (DMT)-like permease